MFGYVTPCTMELKVKEWYLYRSYYCGLCKAIKNNFGELPRLSLNNDMTFMSILLDSLDDSETIIEEDRCFFHPLKKRTVVKDNAALNYGALCNLILVYHKLHDDFDDDFSLKGGLFSKILDIYLKKLPDKYIPLRDIIMNRIAKLMVYELSGLSGNCTIDEVANPFSELTGELLAFDAKPALREPLYELGYNLGKWIYIIDAFDDLEDDMKKKKFNAIENSYNKEGLSYEELFNTVKDKIDFLLFACGNRAYEVLQTLPIKKNKILLDNVLNLGLQEKTFKVFNKKSDDKNNITEILSEI